MVLPRRPLVRSVLLSTAAMLPLNWRPQISAARPPLIEVPLSLCGGAYCVRYELDGQPFRAVVDTGSPFLLVDGSSCRTTRAERADPRASNAAALSQARWGCYQGAGIESGLEDTDEFFGGQDVGVQWRRGGFAIGEPPAFEQDMVTFGRVTSYVGKGGDGAVFLGLVKERLPRIRPTLLEQTAIQAMHFDFGRRRLSLARAPLIRPSEEACSLIDLRPRGAPVFHYAVKVRRLIVNGQVVSLERPVVAVIDTGTTGLSISEPLYESERLPLPMRDCVVELEGERGNTCTLEASVRRRRKQSVREVTAATLQGGFDADADEFPLIVAPVRLPWFKPGFGEKWGAEPPPRRSLLDRVQRRRDSYADGLGAHPDVLFVGLAFLWQRRITIDIDAKRMLIV